MVNLHSLEIYNFISNKRNKRIMKDYLIPILEAKNTILDKPMFLRV